MKIGLVTDIHAGPDFNTKRGTAGEQLLEAALADMAAAGCDLVIDLGDRITEQTPNQDRAGQARIAASFLKSGLPHLHLFGNHDLYSLTRTEGAELFGDRTGSRIIACEGVSLVLFDGDLDCPERRMHFTLSDDKLDELRTLLDRAEGPTLVFSHVPLFSRSMEGSFYFERAFRGGQGYTNAEAIRSVLEAAPRLLACFAGHVHWSSLATFDGIHAWTIGSMTETMSSHPEPEGAYAIVTIGPELEVDVRGRQPLFARLPLRRPGHRWINLDRPGAPRPAALEGAWYREAFR